MFTRGLITALARRWLAIACQSVWHDFRLSTHSCTLVCAVPFPRVGTRGPALARWCAQPLLRFRARESILARSCTGTHSRGLALADQCARPGQRAFYPCAMRTQGSFKMASKPSPQAGESFSLEFIVLFQTSTDFRRTYNILQATTVSHWLHFFLQVRFLSSHRENVENHEEKQHTRGKVMHFICIYSVVQTGESLKCFF